MPKTIWRLYDTHRFPTAWDSPYSHITPELKIQVRSALIDLFQVPEGFLLLRGSTKALEHLPPDTAPQVYDLLYDAQLTSMNDAIKFTRMDLLELAPDRRDELILCATAASIEYHILIPFLESEILDKLRELGFIHDRNLSTS